MNGLTDMITGLGQVQLLSGRIWLNESGFGSATRCAPMSPLGRDAVRLGHDVDSAEMPNSIEKFQENSECHRNS
jgi:hypothetical protein